MIKAGVYADENATKEMPRLSVWPTRLWMRNEGDVVLHKANIDLSGEYADNVQLAIDVKGEPGVWAAPGMGIIGIRKVVLPGESFPFWARAVENPDVSLDFAFEVELEGKKY